MQKKYRTNAEKMLTEGHTGLIRSLYTLLGGALKDFFSERRRKK